MKLYNRYLDLSMQLKNTMTNILVLESPKMYRDIVQNLYQSIEEENEDWIFSEDEKILKKSASVDVVNSLFSLDFENRKMQKKVLEDLYEAAMDAEHYVKTQKLLSDLEAYFYELEWELPYTVKVEIADFRNILKAGIMGLVSPDDLMEKFCEYIKISGRLLNSKIIVLIGIQDCFDEKEWQQLEEAAMYEGVTVLCIEKHRHFNGGNEVIVDSDGCRVV